MQRVQISLAPARRHVFRAASHPTEPFMLKPFVSSARYLHRTPRILGPGAGYRQAQESGFVGTFTEYLSELRSSEVAKRYEEAVAQGYTKTFDVWKVEYPSHRTNGDLPFISSLKRLKKPRKEDMILMKKHYSGPIEDNDEIWAFGRHVVFDGRDLGLARVGYGALKGVASGDTMWVRPYFDPKKKVLGLQGLDGSDLQVDKRLSYLAARTSLRPLLLLAQAEGLLAAIPDDRLRSLHFDRVRESGFSSYATGQKPNGRLSGPRRRFTSSIPVQLGETRRSVRVSFYVAESNPPEDLTFFPYIGDTGRLHLWDVVRSKNIVRAAKADPYPTSDGCSAEEVRSRWPVLFALAQAEGFWGGSPSVIRADRRKARH